MNTTDKDRMLDLCCGAGGGAVGFEDFFQVDEAVELREDPATSYQKNHPGTKVREMDVLDYFAGKNDFEGVHGILATPPCQGFSRLNKHARAGKLISDQNSLTDDIVGRVLAIKPQWVVLENVPQIHPEIRERAEKAFRAADYKVVSERMNAADFGSAQRRVRWILVATRDRAFKKPAVSAPKTVRDAFTALPDGYAPRRVTSERLITRFAQVRGDNGPVWQRTRGHAFADTCRLVWDMPAPAVVNIAKTYMLHPEENRPIDIEEALCLFGLKSNYYLHGNVMSRGQQVANMMTVEMGREIARALA